MRKPLSTYPTFLVYLFLLAACASATPTAEPTPTLEPGQVSVSGALNSTYTTSYVDVNQFTGENLITLGLESEIRQEYPILHIWVYEGIHPGKHPIVNSLIADGVSASFFYSGEEGDYTFWSTYGSIELSATAGAYSGSFTFTASDEDDPSRTITVTGNFERVAVGELAAKEPTATQIAAKEAATQTVVPQPATGSIVVKGNLELSYTPEYMAVEFGGIFDNDDLTEIRLLIESPQEGVDSGVALYVLDYVEPGTYEIGNFVTNEGYIFARFDYVDENGTAKHYSSTQGEITLTETGSVFSGSFSFKAILHMGEGMEDETNNISVTGEFKGIVVEVRG